MMNVEQITIRRVRPDDFSEWLRLRLALWPTESAEALADELADLAADPEQPVFVAALPDGRLCGLVEVAIHRSAPGCSTDRIGYLEGWYVEPAWRGRKVGGRLVAAAEDWALAQGCTEMASDTNSDYPLSPAAHAKLGYREVKRDIFFHKSLLSAGNPGE